MYRFTKLKKNRHSLAFRKSSFNKKGLHCFVKFCNNLLKDKSKKKKYIENERESRTKKWSKKKKRIGEESIKIVARLIRTHA